MEDAHHGLALPTLFCLCYRAPRCLTRAAFLPCLCAAARLLPRLPAPLTAPLYSCCAFARGFSPRANLTYCLLLPRAFACRALSACTTSHACTFATAARALAAALCAHTASHRTNTLPAHCRAPFYSFYHLSRGARTPRSLPRACAYHTLSSSASDLGCAASLPPLGREEREGEAAGGMRRTFRDGGASPRWLSRTA